MQSLNKNRIAYLASLTLLFSYAEYLMPRFIPFFKFGLGNIAILRAFSLPLPSFLLLTLIKSFAAGLTGGTLLTPFFIISVCQSTGSALTMYGLNKIRKNWLSVYGISLAGGAVSAVIQAGLSSLYLGTGTFVFLGPMLLFSAIASIITAFLSMLLKIPEEAPVLDVTENSGSGKKTVMAAVIIFLASVAIFLIQNIYILIAAMIASLLCQVLCRRKIFILPHVSIWIFVITVSLFTPEGKVLFKVFSFPVTQNALLSGIKKALKLSAVSALSQCAASLRPSGTSLSAMTLAYYRNSLNVFRNSSGNILKRLQAAVSKAE